MSRQPKLMNFSQMRAIFEPHLAQVREHLYISNELGIVYGDPRVFRLVVQQEPPFTIDDYRIGVLVRGEIRVSVNLVERCLTPGTLVFLGPGTVIHPVSFSADLEIYGVSLFSDFPMPFGVGQMPAAFNGQVRDFQLKVGEAEVSAARRIIDLLWQMVHQPDYHRPTVSSLVAALMHHYDGIYRQYANLQQATQSREQSIFDRFIYLVNQHSQREHRIGFYAEKMCLTERYLGTVVRQASGITAKEWIDRSLITTAKVMLRHSDRQIAQIAEDLNFPNASFFSKYFKRLTGMTPGEFQGECPHRVRTDGAGRAVASLPRRMRTGVAV